MNWLRQNGRGRTACIQATRAQIIVDDCSSSHRMRARTILKANVLEVGAIGGDDGIAMVDGSK